MGKKYTTHTISIGDHNLDAPVMVQINALIAGGLHSEAGYLTEESGATRLTDAEIAAMGYIKTYTDTDTNTQLSDAQIAEMGYIKTYTDTDTNTQLTTAQIAAMGYIKENEDRRHKVLRFTGEGSNSNNSVINYGIYQEGGAWTHPYPDLVIGMHTGIKIGGAQGYNGTRFYSDAPGRTGAVELMSVGNGDGDVRVTNVAHAGNSFRAPIFYDSNNTDYYLNPAGTSNLNVINATGGTSTEWNTAHGWGNHADEGYLTSYTDTDTNTQLTDAQIAEMGYIKTYTDTNTTYGNTDFVDLTSAQTVGGIKTFTSDMVIKNGDPTLGFADTTADADDFYIHVNSNNFYVLADRNDSGLNNGITGWDGSHPLQLESDTNKAYTFGNEIYHTGNLPTIPSGNSTIDWTTDQGGTNIHSGNYTNTDTNTQLTPAQVLTSIKAVDGSGSGLDADTVDGSHSNLSYGAGRQYDFTINGDADTFYPVVIMGANNARMTRLTVFRGYSETAPSTWNTASHKGGLTLDMDIRVGGWGGYPNMINVHDFGEIYSRICGGAYYTAHTMKFVVWLRGGGASYHIDSPNKNLDIEVNDSTSADNYVTTNTWYSYESSNAAYQVTVVAKNLTEADAGANALLAYMPIRSNGNQNKVISSVAGLGYISSTGSMRAPYFYDSNDTNYYLDPASSSNLFSVSAQHFYGNLTGNASTATLAATATTADLIKVNDYASTTNMRILGSHQTGGSDNVYSNASMYLNCDTGIINATGFVGDLTGNASSATIAAAYLPLSGGTLTGDITVGSGKTSSNIYMADSDGTARRIHTNSNRIGFLTSGNGWGSYCTNNGDWTTDMISYAGASMRAPVFYDSNDTNYYLNPASTSNLNIVQAVQFQGSLAGTASNANTLDSFSSESFLRSDGDDTVNGGVTYTWTRTDTAGIVFVNNTYNTQLAMGGWTTTNSNNISRIRTSSGNLHIDSAANGNTYLNWYSGGDVKTNSLLQSDASLRAPIFYDSNNTGYYLDPASTSSLNGLTVNGTITGNISGNANTLDNIDSSRIVYGHNEKRSTRADGVGIVSTTQHSGFHYGSSPTGGATSDWENWITCAGGAWTGSNNYDFKISHPFHSDKLHVSRMANGVSYDWRQILTTGMSVNIGTTYSFTGAQFYDASDTQYVVDPGGNSQLNRVKLINNTTPLMIKVNSGYKTWVHHIASDDTYVFAPSTANGGETWDWSNQMGINTSGVVTANNFVLRSDERSKTKIKNLTRDNIDVSWKSFEMKGNEGEYRTGVIAQELEETHPEFVNTDSEGFKSVKYIDLLIAKIAELEARLEILEK